ncbi:mannosyltransferase-like protein [Microstroma glucosiphilum]|uniref:Mannosyltransferase-like protein n=1 Tax=Pseudomicrostroma glucosiphilum TaxID=1684307 RepID=A0A316TZD4_9BASI|nr:mannosyltransferase-like protein [Pseudomicrostroma glucosiphilum]PWN18542.1 mannosyltransferase-like protein [Pseudomicrostroma glucosiphilum]
MHFAFLTIPSAGEFNVQLASAGELIELGHRVTFLSGESFRKHIGRFQDRVRETICEEKAASIHFVSLGSRHSVEDFTPTVQQRIHEMRQPPGEVLSLQTCIEVAMVDTEELASTAAKIANVVSDLDPDLIIVDVLSPAMITGIRMTGRKFLLTIPCSPGMTARTGLFEPHPMAGDRRGSWPTLIESTYIRTRSLVYCALRPDMRAKRALLKDTLGLKSFGLTSDLSLLPPYWEDPNCLGGVHFNTFALTDCLQQPDSIVFVGAGVNEEPPSCGLQLETAEQMFLGQALADGCDVVYINMGSMFIWTSGEFQAITSALQDVYHATNCKTRFIFKVNKPEVDKCFLPFLETGKIPSFIHLTTWIDSQQFVYRHPALKAFVHHGGGNSFNEAVYFAVPQLVLSQWIDTHEYASLTERFGLGLRSAEPPTIHRADVRDKLLELLAPARWEQFKSNSCLWSLRSRLGGGPRAAAQFIECHALNIAREKRRDIKSGLLGYSFPGHIMKDIDRKLHYPSQAEVPLTVVTN